MTIIEMHNAKFRWANNSEIIIDIPKLEILHGDHVFIKGPSGCGKSSLLSLFTGIQTLTQGNLSVLGSNLKNLSASNRDQFRADHIGYIFQQFNLIPYLNTIENVLLSTKFSKKRKNISDKISSLDQAHRLLDRLNLPKSLHDCPVSELSIGQQQRVAAARALIGEPELIIADEPTSALDHSNRCYFLEILLEQANDANSTLVFVSHDPTLEPMFKRAISLPEINRACASRKLEEGK